ncbi:MAG: ABC transporter substrate-binding protein [Elusimicrobia bacterium]|nr:ABC transporter substrate-binding protein [Elusimicrobiota bacterium]
MARSKSLAVAVAALSALLPGLTPAAHAQIRNPGTFMYTIMGDVDSLDPHWQYDGISHEMIFQLYETLIFYKGSSITEFEPMIATIVPSTSNGLISADKRTYSFPLRKGVKFHDGSPLTPADVKYSVMRFLLSDRAGGPSVLLLEPILGIATTRDKDGKPVPGLFEQADKAVRIEGGSLVLELKQPFAPLLSILAAFCPIVSKPWTIANGGWDGSAASWAQFNNPSKEAPFLYDHVNGTGPFMLERWDKKQKQIILKRFEDYWRGPAKLERIVYKTLDEFSTRRLMLAAGDADASLLEREFLPQIASLAGIKVEDDLPFLEVHNAFIFNFKVNATGSPYVGSGKLDGDGIPSDFFSDIEVRRGFANAFDYDAYIRDGYRGKGSRARGPIPVGVFGYNERQSITPFDPKASEEHFRKAHKGQVWEKGFRVAVAYMQGRADRQLACEILKKGVESINPKFKVDIRAIQWSTYLSAWQAGKLPLVNARWALDFPDPHNAVFPFLHSQGHYAKVAGYSNPRADRVISEAVAEAEPDKRKALYAELQRIAYEDVPQIFTLDTKYVKVYQSWVKGGYYNPIMPYGYFYPVMKGATP